MEFIGKILLFGGLIVAIVSQLYIVILAFRRKIIQGLLCLIIPAYVLVFAMREETRHLKVLGMWGLGLIAFIIGVIVLS